jgi:hypothetical protein
MLRAVLLGVLTVSAVSACKSGGESAKSQPGVAAGKVVEVTGNVTLHHGDAAHPLAKGESVEGDDVVETGADGNAIIELAHNLARWELGPNKKSKVSDSVAWSLPKKSGTTANVDQDTAAAGRPAERSAADTTVSAETAVAPAAPADKAPAAQGAAPPAAAAAPAAEPPPPPPKPERERAPAKTMAPRAATEDVLDAPSGGGGGAPHTRGGGGTTAGADTAAHDVVTKSVASIKACLTKDAQEVHVTIHVDAAGKATTVVTAKAEVPDRVKQCVSSAVSKLTFAHAPATVSLDVQH